MAADGIVLTQGSGVVVAPEGVVTNRHVVERAAGIRVRRGSQTWVAKVAHWDPDHDLCQLRVSGFPAPPVPIRPSTTLQTGERVYAIGAPEGLELTLSEGLTSNLRPYEEVQLIQTTAPISAGSSGGGLFDAQGRLVGLTTFRVKEGQNLNFALPGERVAALPTHPTGPRVARGGAPAPVDDAVLWLYVAVEADKAQDWAKAAQAYREVVCLKPDIAFAWVNLGNVYSKQGQDAQAILAYREAIRLDQNLALAWYNLGAAYNRQGQPAEVAAAFREVLRLKPDDVEAWTVLGVAYDQQRQPAQAILAYREAVRLNPEYAGAWLGLGLAYDHQGQTAQAIPAFQEALRLNPHLAEAWFGLGAAHSHQGQPAQAILAYREAVRLKPDLVAAWNNLGIVYASQGDRVHVIEVYQKLKMLDPAKADEFFRTVVLP